LGTYLAQRPAENSCRAEGNLDVATNGVAEQR
jgi:hypothetical protein